MNRVPDRGAGEGRNIDPSLGMLAGEAAQQHATAGMPREGGAPHDVWERTPEPDAADPTYYERPALKEPVWIWAVPAYFYAGGVAGAAATLGWAAQSLDGDRMRGLVERCRWIAAAGAGVGTALLIADLGRPARFLHMLRVFRPTSPMSIGSWALAQAAPLMGASAVLSKHRGLLRALGDAAGAGAGFLGLPLAGYTAVLLSNTAVPVWQATRRTLPALFVGSAMASAASLLDLLRLGRHEEKAAHRFGMAGKVAELAASFLVEREASRVERVGRPLRAGPSEVLWRGARLLSAASLLLSLPPRPSRRRRTVSGLLGTIGSLALRFAVFEAGKASSRDPRATFHQQRAGR